MNGPHAAGELDPQILDRARRIRLLCLDVDGVLTDGRLYYGSDGSEMKAFDSQDGHAIKMLAASGVRTAIITGRTSDIVQRRSEELGIDHLYQGAHDKRVALEELIDASGIPADAMAHMGDDLPDVAVFTRVGMALAPANALRALDAWIHHRTVAKGGRGAVREVCELILRAQGHWDAALAAAAD